MSEFGRDFRFVGRGRELKLLLEAVRRAPAVVGVEGDAGMGKSRLVREACTARKVIATLSSEVSRLRACSGDRFAVVQGGLQVAVCSGCAASQ